MKFYLESIDKGAKYVAVDEYKMLGTNFQSLVHVSVKEETKQIESGKWLCDSGKWHTKNVPCSCDIGYSFEGGVAREIPKNSNLLGKEEK